MIYQNLSFFNVSQLEHIQGMNGVVLQRFPEEVRNNLGYEGNTGGRFVAQASTGCEIRFVTDSKRVRISLSAIPYHGEVIVYHGDYFHSIHRINSGRIETLELVKNESFFEVQPEILRKGRFSPHVWRILFSRGYNAKGNFSAVFHHLDCGGHAVRPPLQEEVPALVWLAYGSSITHGAGATVHHNAYIQHAARCLGADVMNKGIGGGCLCEKEVCDYIGEGGNWSFATLELGVNMRDWFSHEEFKRRVEYLVVKILENNPGKPVFLISIYPNCGEFPVKGGGRTAVDNEEFNKILEQVYMHYKGHNLHFIQGREVLSDFSGLTCDLLHPSDYGHQLMGQNLSRMLRPVIEKI